MVGSFDFASLPERLDQRLCDLVDEENKPLVVPAKMRIWPAETSLSECLIDMYKRHDRVSFVSFPKGVPKWRTTVKEADFADSTHIRSPRRQVRLSGSPVPGRSCSDREPLSPSAPADDPSYTKPQISVVMEDDEKVEQPTTSIRLPQLERTLVALDMRDVVHVVVDLYHQYCDSSVVAPADRKQSKPLIEEVLNLSVGDVANVSRRNTFCCITETASLRALLQQFEEAQWIIICKQADKDSFDQIEGLFTVIDFMNLINRVSSRPRRQSYHGKHQTTTHLGAELTRKSTLTPFDIWTATMIKAATHPGRATKNAGVDVCFEDEPLLFVLKLLNRTGYSAVPIVAYSNPRACCAVFSAQDILTILLRSAELSCDTSCFEHLSIIKCISAIREIEESSTPRYPVIHVFENDRLDTVLDKIVTSNVRRLILMDHEKNMTAVLSVTDLGRFIARAMASS